MVKYSGKIQGGFGVMWHHKLPFNSIILQAACHESSKAAVLSYIFNVVHASVQGVNI